MAFKLARLKQWWANPLGLEGDEVLLAQLRLVASNQVAGAMGVVLAVGVLSWTLADQIGHITMGLWALAMASLMWMASRHARQNHTQGIVASRARPLVRRLMVGGAIHGLLWGSLGWLTLGRASDKSSYLVLAVIAGVSGGATATLAPLLPLQLAFLLPVFFMITLKIWWLGDPAYFALGVTCVAYLASLLHHGLVNARATRTTIGLRFENFALLDQLHAETQLAQEARLEAEQANAAKSKFLAAASHDLRQPIHAQGLFLEVLAHTALDARQRELLASAGAAREASAEMLNTLLDFSRIEAGVVQPQVQAFRVQNLLNKIEREFGQQADAKGLGPPLARKCAGAAIRPGPGRNDSAQPGGQRHPLHAARWLAGDLPAARRAGPAGGVGHRHGHRGLAAGRGFSRVSPARQPRTRPQQRPGPGPGHREGAGAHAGACVVAELIATTRQRVQAGPAAGTRLGTRRIAGAGGQRGLAAAAAGAGH